MQDSPATAATRYCNASIRFPIGESLALVHSEHSGALRTLTHDAAALLDSCRTFKTLDEHARTLATMSAARGNQIDELLAEASANILPSFIAKRLKNGAKRKQSKPASVDQQQFESLKTQLAEFVSNGLMISDSELLNLLEVPIEQEQPARITSLAVITHDRVAALARCLESYIHNTRRHGRRVDFVVVDDSDQPRVREDNRQVLTELKKNYDVDIWYAGAGEKKRFAAELQRRANIPDDIVTFALFGVAHFGPAIGANRNALLLQTPGELVFSADDDTVCRLTPSPRIEDRLSFFSQGDPTQFWFYPTREALLEATTFVEHDLLALHEELLGRNLRARVAHPQDVELSQTTADFLRSGRAARRKVSFTFSGIFGDSAMHSPHSYFLLADESRSRLVESAEAYRSATSSREVLRVVNQPTVSSSWWFPTTAFGFDNRELAPPFFPVLRNEDGVFGVTVRSCLGETYVGCLPWALLHAPIAPRSYTPGDFAKSAAACRVSDILSACMSVFEPVRQARCAAERLKNLGAFLMDNASLPQPEFEEFVRLQLSRVASGYASRLEADLRNHRGAPGYWADDVKAYLNTLVPALSCKEYVVPRDLIDACNGKDPRKVTQMLTLNFGKLLWWWPEMMETAREMKEQGIGLAVRM